MRLVIYGDFNYPSSGLASDRATRLEATGSVSRGLGALTRPAGHLAGSAASASQRTGT